VNDALVDHIDLTGVEQLTDAFFALIYKQEADSLFSMNVTKLTLQGCTHITDVAIHFIVKTFPKLQTVGYRKITY